MKTTRLLVLAISILFVLNGSVCPLFAKAPTTPKILFTSARMGWQPYEIYSMNPDGSEQVRLNTAPRKRCSLPFGPPRVSKIIFVSNRGGERDSALDESRWNQRPTRLQEKNRSSENIADLVPRW